MPKRIPEKELDAIVAVVAVVAAQPEAVPFSTILKALPTGLEQSTLQRRLALLVEQERLIADSKGKGKGKGKRYRAPIQNRRPVGYRPVRTGLLRPGAPRIPAGF